MDGSTAFYTPAEVAAYYRVAEYTVRKWIRQGHLGALDISGGDQRPMYRIRPSDIREFESQNDRKREGDQAG